jgi:Protein kinase domain
MGVVYRARELDLDRDVAIKVIAPELVEDPQSRDRFLMEARAASAVEHPNVVPVHHVGVADGLTYLVMRYVRGDNLLTVVRRQQGLSARRAAGIAADLGDALDAIHRAGYVHRDVKPQNVMLDQDEHVYLSDFGLAKQALATSGPTKSDQWVGTLDYVAPEQIRGGPVDARTDVYSLGGVLYFMLTAHVPFERSNDEAKLWAHLSTDAPPPSALRPELPPAIDGVVQRALSRDPAQRQLSAGDLGRDARDAAAGVGSTRRERMVARGAAAPAGTPQSRTAVTQPTTVSAPRRLIAAATRASRARLAYAGVALALVAIAAFSFLPEGDRRNPSQPGPDPTEPVAAEKDDGPRVGATIRRVGFRPRDIVVAAGDLWIISHDRPRVTRLDAESGRRQGDQPLVGRGASSIAAHDDAIWVAVPARGEVVRVDPRSGHVKARIEPPMRPVRVAVGPSGLWVVGRAASAESPDVLLHYDRSGGRRLHETPFRRGINAIALGVNAVWVALAREPRIVRLSLAARRQFGATLTSPASALAFGGGYLWASVTDDDAVARVSPARGQTVTTAAARAPGEIAVADGRVFVASNIDHTVVVLDPKRPRRTGTPVKVALNPWAVTAGAGHVWVTGVGRNTVTRLDY